MAAVETSGHAVERAALEDVVAVVTGLSGGPRRRARRPGRAQRVFERVLERWDDEPADVARRGAALDVALIHVASMSNLHAALGWALVDLVEHPDALARVRSGDGDHARRCCLESTRLAQRSLMARHVLRAVSLDVGGTVHEVPPGWTIATLLPLLNTSAADGLAHWDPERWDRHRLRPVDDLASPALVTAFGHGRHTCPAQPFALAAMSTAVTRLVEAYDLEPAWTSYPRPVAAQIGGVARAGAPVPLSYRRRR